MRLTFWGVRGSFPVAHPKVTRIGGNTSCVALDAPGEPLIVIDSGTGFRHLGRSLTKDSPFAEGKGEGAVLFSHMHWDHIQGFMYFEPFFRAGNKFTIVARSEHDRRLRSTFQSQAESPYFDFGIETFKAELRWKAVAEEETFKIGNWSIRSIRLNHPGIAIGYRVELKGRVFLYMTDTAPWQDQLLEEGFNRKKAESDPDVIARIKDYGKKLEEAAIGGHLLLYDTFFTPEQYKATPHWGHSTPDEGIRLARLGGVGKFYFFHHHPEAWDDDLEARVSGYQKKLGGSDLAIEVAREGESIEV